jgi:hypothetical protein
MDAYVQFAAHSRRFPVPSGRFPVPRKKFPVFHRREFALQVIELKKCFRIDRDSRFSPISLFFSLLARENEPETGPIRTASATTQSCGNSLSRRVRDSL